MFTYIYATQSVCGGEDEDEEGRGGLKAVEPWYERVAHGGEGVVVWGMGEGEGAMR